MSALHVSCVFVMPLWVLCLFFFLECKCGFCATGCEIVFFTIHNLPASFCGREKVLLISKTSNSVVIGKKTILPSSSLMSSPLLLLADHASTLCL